jgi:deoxyribonuclease-4
VEEASMKLGVHVSISGSLDRSIDRALELGCETFQIFTRNPRQWAPRNLTQIEVEKFTSKLAQSKIMPVVAHMPYLPNIASPRKDVYKKSVNALKTEIQRCEVLNIPYLVSHLGSHLGSGRRNGYRRAIDACNQCLSKVDNDVVLLLENSAGTRNSIGRTFEDIQQIIEGIEHKDRVGVCFDTCHAFAAGYELRDETALENTLKKIDVAIGLNRIRIIHLNDSKGGLGSKVDRHEHIGLGFIGERGFQTILKNKTINSLPLILETPVDARRDDYENLAKVKELAKKP